jgi:ABC-type branched-subunit amino acid transport system ATPase component
MAAGSSLLQMEQVNKYFGDLHVLQDVDLEVDAGEVVIVVGPSGSGKSTAWSRSTAAPSASTGSPCPARAAPWPGSAPRWAWCSSSSTCSRT